MIPKEIETKHVLQAMEELETTGPRFAYNKSSVYDLIYKGKPYPPKHLLAIAADYATGKYLEYGTFNSTEARNYLSALSEDFKIQVKNSDPFLLIIEKYKEGIQTTELKDERYKWDLLQQYKGRPELSSNDFYADLKSIDYGNLMYGLAIAVMNHMSADRPHEYFTCFQLLFNEEVPLEKRVKQFFDELMVIYRGAGVEKLSHQHDERTISTLLAFKKPEKYPLFKDSVYNKFCYHLKAKPAKHLSKYIDYIQKLNAFIEQYIKTDQDLLDQVRKLLPDTAYADPNYLLLAQDILYQVLDKGLGEQKKYWRVGTSDGETSYWQQMKDDDFIAIGWPKLGDLNDLNLIDAGSLKPALGKHYYKKDPSTLGKKVKEIFSFYNDVNVGDVILAQNGHTILGIGTVQEAYQFVEEQPFPHQKSVHWIEATPSFKNATGTRTTIAKLNEPALIDKVEHFILNNTLEKPHKSTQNNMTSPNQKSPLNQILYGPPGTGKTYSSIELALKIIDEKEEQELDWSDRQAVKNLYDIRVAEKRIVFTTFHQNMSYEDFIEGIKPETADGKITYAIKNGIFKQLCEDIAVPNTLGFDQAYDDFRKDLAELDGLQQELSTPRNKAFSVSLNSNGNLSLHTGIERKIMGVLTRENLQRQLNGESRFEGWEGYFKGVVAHLKNRYGYSELKEDNSKRYVLIIDEINRGNVSQIFGELITLIEEGKRKGRTERLEVILPYSKQPFSVPDNLYLVGTMNTADRSVEALDTALRRRFSFVEKMPDYSTLDKVEGFYQKVVEFHKKYEPIEWTPYVKDYRQIAEEFYTSIGLRYEIGGKEEVDLYELIESKKFSIPDAHDYLDFLEFRPRFSLAGLLKKINERIELLYDREHQVGHSFFLKIINLANPYPELRIIFKDEVIPLLQEYFFGDYEKIALVLGPGFVMREMPKNVLAVFPGISSADFNKPIFKIRMRTLLEDELFRVAITQLWDGDKTRSMIDNE
jgi:Cdc6-like AAA superfamily ATPase